MALQYAYLLDPNLLVEGVSLRLIGLIWPQASPNTARGGRQDPASHAAHTRAEGWVLITNTADSVFVVQAAAVLQEAEDWDTYHEVDVIIVTSRIWGVGPSWGAQMPHFPGGECGVGLPGQHLPPELRAVSPWLCRDTDGSSRLGCTRATRVPAHLPIAAVSPLQRLMPR